MIENNIITYKPAKAGKCMYTCGETHAIVVIKTDSEMLTGVYFSLHRTSQLTSHKQLYLLQSNKIQKYFIKKLHRSKNK